MMTTETMDWRALPAGRDLDRLIHERLFSKCAHRNGWEQNGQDGFGFALQVCRDCGQDMAGTGFVPWYSASWDNAARIVAKLRADGWLLYLHEEGGKSQQWVACFVEDSHGADVPDDSGEELGATAPLAICYAALATMEG